MPFTWSGTEAKRTVEISASDERGVFAEGCDAMRELLGRGVEAPGTRRVALAGTDRAALLADFLAELAIVGDTEGLLPARLVELELRDDGLVAEVQCATGEPRTIVTGATYERLAFERTGDGWYARATLGISRG
jgi:SHS2 domain-containing protein